MADAPDTTTAEAQTVAPAPPRSASPLLPLAGGAIAAVLVFGIAQVIMPPADLSGLQSTITAQSTEIAALKAELQKLADQPAATPDKALSDRVTALEAAPQPDLAPLTTRLDDLEQRIAALPTTGADPAALTALQTQIDDLKTNGIPQQAITDANAAFDAKLAEVDTRLTQITADAQALADKTARRAALAQLQAAVDSGMPFTAALSALSGETLPALLSDNAQSGLPSLQALQASFPEAARAALDASLRADMGQTWTERLTSFLQGQTGARSLTPREGSDPDAVLSRAEAALKAGDLTVALSELQALPPEGQAAMTDWTAAATLRQDAAAAVQALGQ